LGAYASSLGQVENGASTHLVHNKVDERSEIALNAAASRSVNWARTIFSLGAVVVEGVTGGNARFLWVPLRVGQDT